MAQAGDDAPPVAAGEPGSRLAEALAIPTSPDTLIRRVGAAAADPAPPPRFVGVDDWACKMGQHYGTILIDLGRDTVIDLLPGRDGEALKAWLASHPQVEVITRDRWPAYIQAAASAAPQAKQVADRFHRLTNVREAVEKILPRIGPDIRAAHAAVNAPPAPTPTSADAVPPAPPKAPTATEQRRSAKRASRGERFRRVKDLTAEGHRFGRSPAGCG